MNKTVTIALLAIASTLSAAEKATITLTPDPNAPVIAKEIYGQFTEHLGSCIYGGIWVGEDSPIPNTNGYRNDVLQAMRELKIPVMRWPGGCFADEYHWVDGIGPKSDRPRMVNNNWGGTIEDNSFGTHEFFNLCEMLGIEPYLSGNVGSGSVEELAKWVEYITAADGPQAKLRRQNGREKPWHLKYLGVGNESWGCGGNMTPEYYADLYRRYQTYCREFDGNRLYKIASGASDYDYNWTDVLMQKAAKNMHGISLHYYSVDNWTDKGSATDFDTDDYYWTMGKCHELDSVITRHSQIMDKYDPKKRIGLLVDEWGTWWNPMEGTNPGHLVQQNTMRDALVAALSLNIFHTHADRVRMANIAQFANVLQAMLLTQGDKMILTPTYHIFKMYVPHQDAKFIPLTIDTDILTVRGNRKVPQISATASTAPDGTVTISLANISLDQPTDISINLGGIKASKITGEILTAQSIADCNTFTNPENVTPQPFKKANLRGNTLTLQLPPHSVVSLQLR